MLFQIILLGIFLAPLPSLGNDLQGCNAVDCPTGPGNITSSQCTVSNTTLDAIGLTSYSLPTGLEGGDLVWTIGVSGHDDVNNESYPRLVERIFYLGTPPSVNLPGTDSFIGCALFIRGGDNGNLIYDNSINPALPSPSICQEPGYIEPDCISSLKTNAADLAKRQTNSTSSAIVCANIAEDIQSNLPNTCKNLVRLSPTFTAVPLTGSDAPEPFTTQENSTSNCYPTLPKSNDLTRVFSYNVSATFHANSTVPAVISETSVMTVFYQAGDVSNNIDPRSDVQFVCLRPIDLTDAAEAHRKNGSDENGASSAYGSYDSTSWVNLASGAVAVLLSFALT